MLPGQSCHLLLYHMQGTMLQFNECYLHFNQERLIEPQHLLTINLVIGHHQIILYEYAGLWFPLMVSRCWWWCDHRWSSSALDDVTCFSIDRWRLCCLHMLWKRRSLPFMNWKLRVSCVQVLLLS